MESLSICSVVCHAPGVSFDAGFVTALMDWVFRIQAMDSVVLCI